MRFLGNLSEDLGAICHLSFLLLQYRPPSLLPVGVTDITYTPASLLLRPSPWSFSIFLVSVAVLRYIVTSKNLKVWVLPDSI